MELVLACVDFTPTSEAVVRHAAYLARRVGAELVLLHVLPAEPEWIGWGVGPESVRDGVAADARSAHRELQRRAEHLREGDLPRVRASTVRGPTPETILERARALGASVIVLGAHHRGAIHELFVGSVTRAVLRRTTCPVLVVPGVRQARG